MKILGNGESGKLLCEVTQEELEKFFNCYYARESHDYKTIRDLRAGSVIYLGKGYDHLSEIKSAFKQMQDFIKANERVIKGIGQSLLLMTDVNLGEAENTSQDSE